MDNRPLFSVIIPLYNKEPHISRCIQSVLHQTLKNFELLIINDASTDNSVQKVLHFSDSRIRIIHRSLPGPGGYAARNLGILQAKGIWIAFLDADDQWLPNHLENMFALEQLYPDCSILSCGWQISYTPSKVACDAYYTKNHQRGSHIISVKDYLKSCIDNYYPICTDVACIKNSPSCHSIFPEGKAIRGGDRYAWIFFLAHHNPMAWSPHIGAIYYRDTVNMASKTPLSSPGIQADLVALLVKVLNTDDLTLLKKYVNRGLWRAYLRDKVNKTNNFDYLSSVFFDGDLFFCLRFIFCSLLPSILFSITAKSIKCCKTLINH